MMIAIANNYGVYFVARYQDLNAAGPDLSVNALVTKTTTYLVKPAFMRSYHDCGCPGSGSTSADPGPANGCCLTALGITFALLCGLLFIPAVMSL